MADPLARLAEIVAEMRSERPRYKSHDLGYVDSVSASRVDEWADEIEAEVAAVRGAAKESYVSVQNVQVSEVRADEVSQHEHLPQRELSTETEKEEVAVRGAEPGPPLPPIAALRAAFTNEVIRAIVALARQQNVCREQAGRVVFVTGMEAAREYLVEQVSAALEKADPPSLTPPSDQEK